MLRIISLNLNGIRSAASKGLYPWLEEQAADIVCLQELKAREAAFPCDAIREAGYHAVVYGQPTFNGVGILSRIEPQNVQQGMNDDVEDPQARFIAAQVGEIQVISAYIPNGQVVGSDQCLYPQRPSRRLGTLCL